MSSFARKLLVALVLMTAIQILPQPALANPAHPATQQSSDSTRNAQKGTAGGSIEMRTDTEGVDFNSYLRALYLSVRKTWYAEMPPSAEKGDKGVVTIQFRVQQDGKIPDDFLKVVFSSSKKEFDNAGLHAIRDAAPFDHLPSKFSQPFVELRMIFYYNTAPPRTP